MEATTPSINIMNHTQMIRTTTSLMAINIILIMTHLPTRIMPPIAMIITTQRVNIRSTMVITVHMKHSIMHMQAEIMTATTKNNITIREETIKISQTGISTHNFKISRQSL